METKKQKTRLVVSLLALGSILTFLAFCMAGDADPGVPSEPPILAEAQPIPALPYTINQPGSYYFTQNLSHTDRYTNAIEVNADNVTIDLAGYSLIGPSAASGTSNGIYMNERRNVEIRNGTITNFGNNGIYEVNDVQASGHRVIAIRATSNGGHGILLWGSNHIVRDCTATFNCLAISSGFGAITCGGLSMVTANVASYNGIVGIMTGSGCMICDNTVSSNYVGILPWFGCSVVNNTVSYNDTEGVKVTQNGNLIKGNTLRSNGTGISVSGSGNSIEGNLVTNSVVGINFSSSQNVYANNRALYNTTNYGGSVPTPPYDGGGNIGAGTLAGSNMGIELQMEALQVPTDTSGTE